jgi:cystathionine beta-lyase/cystathionine gamma-synthase
MAAITSLLLLFKPGDEIIVSDDLYGGTYRLFQEIMQKYGFTFHYVDFENEEGVRHILERGKVAALFVETPTNPLLKIADVRAVVEMGKEFDAMTIVDSTFATPILMRPIEFGAQVVLHSATKYLGGHNDLIGGLIVAAEEELGERLYFKQKAAGAILGPFDCWLLLRGMKTLHVRFEKAQENAVKVSEYLMNSPHVKKVYFPGIPGHRGNDIHFSQSDGPGAMLSFELEENVSLPKFFDSLQVINLAESLGGVESLTTHPATMTHVDIPEEERLKIGITHQLVRLSVGIEEGDDLVVDLGRALEVASP